MHSQFVYKLNLTLWGFCVAMMWRADIEGSISNIAVNAWVPALTPLAEPQARERERARVREQEGDIEREREWEGGGWPGQRERRKKRRRLSKYAPACCWRRMPAGRQKEKKKKETRASPKKRRREEERRREENTPKKQDLTKRVFFFFGKFVGRSCSHKVKTLAKTTSINTNRPRATKTKSLLPKVVPESFLFLGGELNQKMRRTEKNQENKTKNGQRFPL